MKHSMLTRLVVGFALTAAVASVNCGGDDTNGTTTGTGGSGGGTGGATGTGGGTGGTTGTGGGTGGSTGTGGGDASMGGSTGTGGGTGGARPDGGTGGTAGSAGTGGARDGGGDADGGAATFAAVRQILQDHCVACHGGPPPQGNRNLIDFTDTTNEAGLSLYQRLTSPLPTAQEGQCFFNAPDSAEAVSSDAAAADGGDAEASAPTTPNRTPIIGGNLPNSYLYQKVSGGFEGQGINPPTGCGQRMPRIANAGYDASVPDAGVAPSVGCDSPTLDAGVSNCLSDALIGQIRAWIQAGAPNN